MRVWLRRHTLTTVSPEPVSAFIDEEEEEEEEEGHEAPSAPALGRRRRFYGLLR